MVFLNYYFGFFDEGWCFVYEFWCYGWFVLVLRLYVGFDKFIGLWNEFIRGW